mgnify:FL=1
MDFQFNNQTIWFHGITGTVKSVQKWSSTSVSSSGGGGFVHPEYGGHVQSAQVSSTVSQHQSFWIVAPDGREKSVENADLPCRDGQSVTLIWGAVKGAKTGQFLVAKNNTTGETAYFDVTNYTDSFPSIGRGGFLLVWFLGYAALCAILVPTLILWIVVPPIAKAHLTSIINKRADPYRRFATNLLSNKEFLATI